MFLISVAGREDDGAYAVSNTYGEKVLYLFEQEDDAWRFASLLEESNDYPQMHVIEIDDDAAVQVCENNGYRYTIISQDDIVIPPEDDDFISED